MKFSEMPYERVEFDKVKAEFLTIMEASKAAKSGEEQFEIHKKYYALTNRVTSMMTIAHIRHDGYTEDEFYKAEQEYYDQVSPELQNLIVAYSKSLYESPYRAYLEEKIGPVAFKNIELSLKGFDEKLIPLMQEENALTTEYKNLLASAKIEWEGEILNLSLMKKHMNSQDRDTRKRAWEKHTNFFVENAEKFDELYDKLVKNRTAQAKELGYENYIELGYYRMQRNCYDKDMVKCFRDQVKKYLVPFAEKLHDRRRQRLGLDKLAYYDAGMFFNNGNPAPIGTPEEILAAGQKMYAELSAETKEFFDFMMENELFDVLGRKNKRAGGYMTYIPDYKSPFIFANFNATAGDVDVITHECGHAFQGFLSAQDPIQEHSDITMETAEIHSMSMEFFTEPWMDLFFGERTKDYLDMHLEDAVMFIPYGCMVDEFQHEVYAHPEMTPAERKAVWARLEKEYKPHLDYTGNAFLEEGGYWQRQHHIYSLPFYYIDYCIAQSCALQYKTRMDEDYKEAWASYLKLCRLSASDFFTNMVKEVGLKNPLEDGCLEDVVKKMEAKLQL